MLRYYSCVDDNLTGVDPVGRLRTTTYYVSTINLTRVNPFDGAALPTNSVDDFLTSVDPSGGATLQT